MNDQQRFISHVLMFGEPDRCWDWTGYVDDGGYGRFGLNGKSEVASRAGWTLFVGDIPEGIWVLHHCDRRICVNFEKCLFLGTRQDNINDMISKGRDTCYQTPLFCPYGHMYDEVNTYVTKSNGAPQCRTCAREKYKPKSRRYHPKDSSYCKNGHSRTPENTIISGGRPRCYVCLLEYNKQYKRGRLNVSSL